MYHNRFKPDFPLDEAYAELKTALQAEAAVSHPVDIKDLRLDLVNDRVWFGDDEGMPLGERAKSVLSERLGLGRLYSVLDQETLETIQPAINEALKRDSGSLILKSRSGVVQGVVSDRYREVPYEDVVTMMEHLEAHPIRIYQNDYNLRMQAIFDSYKVSPADGEPLNLGVQLRTSDMGVGALAFDVFTYRWICSNGCIMGKKSVQSFRAVHVSNIREAERDVREQVVEVLTGAQKRIETVANKLIEAKADRDKVIGFIAKQPFGKKASANLVERIVKSNAQTMWDVFNILTEAGHDPAHSQSMQLALETSAGQLADIVAG